MAIDQVIRVSLFSLSVCWHSMLTAQYQVSDLSLDRDPHLWYDLALGPDKTNLVLGVYEPVIRAARNTHQFYQEDRWKAGRIHYRGQVYDSIFLMYNIESDVVLLRHPTDFTFHTQPIRPIQKEVMWFELQGHFFRRYSGDLSPEKEGFYDELYVGDSLRFVVKRQKEQSIVDNAIEFLPTSKLLLYYAGEYHRINRKGSIMRLLKPHKKEIRRYIQANLLEIKPENEAAILSLVQYCDQLLTHFNEPN